MSENASAQLGWQKNKRSLTIVSQLSFATLPILKLGLYCTLASLESFRLSSHPPGARRRWGIVSNFETIDHWWPWLTSYIGLEEHHEGYAV